MSGQGSHTPLHTGIPPEQCVGDNFRIVRALEVQLHTPVVSLCTPGLLVHHCRLCGSSLTKTVISTGLYVAVRKENMLVVPCLKMLNDSSLLSKSHSNSAIRVFCMSFNFPFLIPAFPYSHIHLRYVNLYNSLSSRCPVLLCFKPMLIFFYSWEHFLSLAHFSPSPSSILLLKILGILQTLFQAPCPASSWSCSHQSPLSLTALCSSLRNWLTQPGAEVSAPVIQTRGCRLSEGLCGPVSTV